MIEEGLFARLHGDPRVTEPKRLNTSLHSRREPVTLALLTVLAVLMFLAVSGLSRLYQAQQQSLALRWSARGAADLNAQRYSAAVIDYRTALRYARSNYSYQLSLAEALIGLNRTDEAYAYLINLWDREPENGFVNLDLARVAVHKGDALRALRYYHNAIYAVWPEDQEAASRGARVELIQYLLGINARPQAQAELVALSASLGDDSPEEEQQHIGDLFLRAQDDQPALAAFRLALKQNPRDEAALAGAGVAAFQLELYPAAQGYLQTALEIAPGDEQSAALLQKTKSVLDVDPYRTQISDSERARKVIAAFNVAGGRLQACSALAGAAAAAPQDLAQQWTKMKPQVTKRGLLRNPDLVNTAMELAIAIERKASGACGQPSESDSALLLVANLHEEN